MKQLLCFLTLYLGVCNNMSAQGAIDTTLFHEGAVPRLISRQFQFTEGPAADKDGNVFFTDQPNNRIWKYSIDGRLHLFRDSAGRANGLYFDKKGRLIACADEHNQLWRINRRGKSTVLLKDYKGKAFNGPNDVWVHPSGGIYFTDPYYQRPYWTRTAPEMEERNVYFLPKGKKGPMPVIRGLNQPNGIIGTADGRWLYVADIGAGKTYRYRISREGTVSEKELFVSMGSDGMTIDERGNLYLTGNGVTIYNSRGQQLTHIPIPEKWTSNVTFGGQNRNQLFITASEAIYIMDMKVKGL